MFGIVTIGNPFPFGAEASTVLGISLIVSGLVFVVVHAVMINQMIDEQHAAAS